jgi:outer membrane protein
MLLKIVSVQVNKLSVKTAFLLMIGGFVTGWSQFTHAADLIDLWKIAEVQDTKYLSAYHKFRSDQEIIELSRADLLPTVSLQIEHKITDQKINQTDNAVFNQGVADYPTDSIGLTLNQSLFDYSRWQRFDLSKISVNRAEVEYSLAKQKLLLRLSESYFLVLERGDQLEAVKVEMTALLKHYGTADNKYKIGLVSKVDVENTKARYLNSLSKKVELQSRLMDSRYALRESLGSMPGKLSTLKTDVAIQMPAPADPGHWVALAAKNNLELHLLNLSLKEAVKEINITRGGHYPTLDLVYTTGNTVTEGSVFGGGSDVDTSEIMIQLNVPLYSGGKTSAQLRQAIAKRYSVLEERNDKQRSVERSAHEAYHRISEAIVQIDALEQSLQAQESRLKATTAGHRSGKNSLIEVLDVEEDLSYAKQALIKARYDYVLNILRLKFAVGGLEEQDLASINSLLMENTL